MNETLKGVAHIGAELAAAKADLQREMERHRKTWRQLEQVTGLLRECLGEGSIDNVMGTDWVERVGAALSQQSEPEGTTSDKYRAELYDEVWEKSRSMGYGNVTDALVELERMKAEPAPAQDEQQAFEAWVHSATVAGCVADMQRGWMARANRPAQTEQQPIGYACQADLEWEDEPIRICRERFRDWQLPVYAAPIAQTAQRGEA